MSDAADLPGGWRRTSIGAETEERKERVGSYADPPIVLSSTKHQGLVPSDDFFRNRTVYSDDLSSYKSVSRNWFAYATNHLAEGSIGLQNRYSSACVSPIYTVFSCRDGTDSSYLYRLLKSPELISQYKLHEQASVDRRGAVRYRDFAEIPLIIPPLAEQQRIVQILDTADEKILSTKLLVAKLERIRLGVIHDLLTHGVSEGRRLSRIVDSVGNEWPETWSPRSVSSCVDPLRPITYGIVQAGPDVQDGIPYLRTVDLKDTGLEIESLLRASPVIANEYRRSMIRTGDVVCAIRATVGKFQIVPEELDGINISRGVARLAPVHEALGEFLALVLNSTKGKRVIAQTLKGSTFLELTLRQLGALEIHLPPFTEQLEIVGQVNALDHRIAAEIRQLNKLGLLKRGLMHDLVTGRVRVEASA
jgi:type I restriction enzyme S subunit